MWSIAEGKSGNLENVAWLAFMGSVIGDGQGSYSPWSPKELDTTEMTQHTPQAVHLGSVCRRKHRKAITQRAVGGARAGVQQARGGASRSLRGLRNLPAR